MIKRPLTRLRAAFRNVEAAHDNVSGIDLISDPAHRFMSGIHSRQRRSRSRERAFDQEKPALDTVSGVHMTRRRSQMRERACAKLNAALNVVSGVFRQVDAALEAESGCRAVPSHAETAHKVMSGIRKQLAPLTKA